MESNKHSSDEQWQVFQRMIRADSCQILLVKIFLQDVSGSPSDWIPIERA